jgi:shikimate kinase
MAADATTASRRPNLTDKDPLAEIEHLLTEREPIYRELADFEIETVGLDPDQLANEILCHLYPA